MKIWMKIGFEDEKLIKVGMKILMKWHYIDISYIPYRNRNLDMCKRYNIYRHILREWLYCMYFMELFLMSLSDIFLGKSYSHYAFFSVLSFVQRFLLIFRSYSLLLSFLYVVSYRYKTCQILMILMLRREQLFQCVHYPQQCAVPLYYIPFQ